MAKGNGDSMSDEEKEIDIESGDEVNYLFHCDGSGSHKNNVVLRICLILFRMEQKMAKKHNS